MVNSSKSSGHTGHFFRDKYAAQILDALPGMLLIIDNNEIIVELISPPHTIFFDHVSPEALISSHISSVLSPETYQKFTQAVSYVLTTGKVSQKQHRIVVKGVNRYFENTISVLDEQHLLCFWYDITEQVIKAEEADRMKADFLANMSHEIRTPLNAVIGFSRLIMDTVDENDKKTYTDIIDQNTKILLNLFDDILDLAAIESDTLPVNYAEVPLYELCLEQYALHKHAIGGEVEIYFDESDKELIIQADWNKISRVLRNLIDNAVKFTPTGEIHFGYKKTNDLILFYVKDTGIGISADKMNTIFQRFGQVDNFVQGTGLGLTVCRLLVEKMGGRIWARSQEGKGTTFFFTIQQG